MSRLQNTNGGPSNAWLQLSDEETGALWQPTYGFGVHNRGAQALAWQWENQQRWPSAGFMTGAGEMPVLLGQDAAQMDYYEPWTPGLGGKNRPFFIRGICKDGSGNILGGAVVYSFITSTNVIDGTAQSDDRGVFEVPCTDTTAHFVDAYYASGSLAGRSVNTLIPTL